MPFRDVVVVGASAGGVEALRTLVAGMPADLPAAVLVVLHMPRSGPSALPSILSRSGPLPAEAAVNGEPLVHGRIYVAPVDRHLLVIDNRIHLSRGPAENGHRPAVDVLFRSAAAAFGPRVVGVVLSGAQDDGAAGLAAIARRGGTTVVQDPADALHSSMPRAALDRVTVDHVLPVAALGTLLDKITRTSPATPVQPSRDRQLEQEVAVANEAPVIVDEIADRPEGYGCPACGGSLFEVEGAPVPHYRCRLGHGWSPESLLDEQSSALESALWIALRALQEKSSLSRRMAGISENRGHRHAQARFGSLARDADEAAVVIRGLVGSVSDKSGGYPVDRAAPAGPTRPASTPPGTPVP